MSKRILMLLALLGCTLAAYCADVIATINGIDYMQHSSGRYYWFNDKDQSYYYVNDPAIISKIEAPKLAPATEPLKVDEPNWWDTEVEQAGVSYDLYFRSLMLRSSNFSLGGGFNIGLKTTSFKFELYGLGDYYMAPLGGSGGAASLEFSIESGVMFAWKFMEVWRTRTYIALDVGYYAQFAKIPQQPDNLFMGYNGIMFRPKVVTELRISKNYAIGIGLFYQIPLYPAYSDYQGFGVMVSIL